MYRFNAPNRLLIVLLLLAMLPVRAALAWAPDETVSTPGGEAVQMMNHGDAGCCATSDSSGEDAETAVCTATCACCAVLATVVATPGSPAFPVPPTNVVTLTHATQPVPLRPPRFTRS